MSPLMLCPRCGWQNDAASRVCGGCGQALASAGAPFHATQTVPLARPPRVGGGSAQPSWAFNDAPTQQAPPRWPSATPAYVAAPARAPVRRSRAGSCLLRGVVGMATTLVLVCVLAGVAWAAVIRPYIHARVDGAIGDGLTQAVASIPPVPEQALQALGAQFTIKADDVNAAFADQAQQDNSGLQNLTVAFDPGAIVLNYSARGQPGTIQTTLRAQNGGLVATQTQVTGPLGWVESGDELQATLDRALAQLRAKTPHGFQSVQTQAGELTVVLNQ